MRSSLHTQLRLITLLSIFALLVAACAGGTTSPGGTTPTTATGATTPTSGAAAPTTSAGMTPTGGAASPTTATGGGMTPTAMTGTTPTTGAGATPAATGTTGGAAVTLPPECTNVQLAYWTPFTGPDGPFMGKLVDSFNAANPQIKVTMTTQSEYQTQLDTAAASDALPDVAIINEDVMATEAFRNITRPMDDLVKQLGLSSNDFPAAAWKNGEVAGKRYGIPLSIVPMTMYYNADLFKAAGISAPPKTGAEFEQDAAKLTQGNNKGFMITTGFPVQQIFQQLLHQYGGTEFNADSTKATWNSDAGVKALQWMKDAQSKYSEPSLPVDADLNAFKAGTVGMIWNGIWQVANVTGSGVTFNGQATAVPQIGTQPAVWAGMASLSLPAHKKGVDKCKDAAAAVFIKYLLDHSDDWSKAGNIPAYNPARNSAAFKQLHPQSDIAPSVENPVFPPAIPGISDAFAPLGDAVGAVMSGSTTDIKGALDSAAQKADQILAQNKAKYGTAPK